MPIRKVLTNNNDFAYTTELYLGTPAQKLTLQIDAGSSNLFVGVQGSGARHLYNHNLSSTYTPNGTSFTLKFVQWGTAKGYLSRDIFRFFPNDLGVPFTFAEITEYTGLLGIEFDGKLGMGFPSVAVPPGLPTMWQVLASQGLSSNWSVFLNGTERHTGDGEILFGGVDYSKFRGHIQYFPIKAGSRFYTIQGMMSITNGSNELEITSSPMDTIIDSGTPGILVPPSLADYINSFFNCRYGNTTFGPMCYFACSELNTDLKVNFWGVGGRKFTISADRLIWKDNQDRVTCFTVFQPYNLGPNTVLWGEAFMRRVYTVYSPPSNVGLAESSAY